MEFDANNLDDELLTEIRVKIILLENKNITKKSISDTQMVKEIKKMIEERVKCAYRV